MRIEKLLDRWRTAGIIDEATSQRISDFEKRNSKPDGIFYVTGLGAISIALGILALVASNWQGIPASLKIVALFVMCALVSYFILRQKLKSAPSVWVLDSLILIYSGLVIAGIGLIGQVFQMRGSVSSPLIAWAIAITPLVFFSVGYVVPLHWTLLVLATLTTGIMEYVQTYGRLAPFYVAITAILLLPLAFIGVGKLQSLREKMPHFSKAFVGLGWVYLVALGSLGQETWNYRGNGLYRAIESVYPALMLTIAGLAIFFGFLKAFSIRLTWAQKILVLFCTMTPYLSLVFDFRSSLLGALGFLFIWALIAKDAYDQQNRLLFKQATSVVGIRLFILYCQTLGGFLGTGVGLVASGVLLIIGVKFWYSKSIALTKAWGPKP